MDLFDILFFFLKRGDWLALPISAGLGYLAGYYMPSGWPSILAAMLVSYHLFLVWLLLTAKDELQTMKSLGYAASVHLACLVVIVSLGSGQLFVPHFNWVCTCVALLAFFERSWLFETRQVEYSEAEDPVASSEEEYHEWLAYVARQGSNAPGFGDSRKQQFEQWLRARRRGDTA